MHYIAEKVVTSRRSNGGQPTEANHHHHHHHHHHHQRICQKYARRHDPVRRLNASQQRKGSQKGGGGLASYGQAPPFNKVFIINLHHLKPSSWRKYQLRSPAVHPFAVQQALRSSCQSSALRTALGPEFCLSTRSAPTSRLQLI